MIQYESSGILNPQKLFLKMQSHIMKFLEMESISFQAFVKIARMYSDLQISASSLFEVLNDRL